MTIHEALQLGTVTLAAVPDPRIDAAALLCQATGMPRMELLLRQSQALTDAQENTFRLALTQRESRKPLQYILGEQCFYGLDFAVDERVLIPRQETETLCELALQRIPESGAPAVLDLCTGSGAIAVVLKHERPNATVTAVDLSTDALEVARQNAQRNHVDVRFLQGDLYAPVANERFDVIVTNPPYIASAACSALQPEVLCEPRMALDGGSDGLDFYRRIVTEAPLRHDGWLCMEIGDTQGASVLSLLQADGRYTSSEVLHDLYGLDRVAIAHAAAFPT